MLQPSFLVSSIFDNARLRGLTCIYSHGQHTPVPQSGCSPKVLLRLVCGWHFLCHLLPCILPGGFCQVCAYHTQQ